MANAVITAHNHVLRRWLRRETDDPEGEFDRGMRTVMDLFRPKPRARVGETAVILLRTDRDLDEVRPHIERLLR